LAVEGLSDPLAKKLVKGEGQVGYIQTLIFIKVVNSLMDILHI